MVTFDPDPRRRLRQCTVQSSALTKLPNGCHFRWGTVGGWGSTRLLLVERFWALWGVRWSPFLRSRALGNRWAMPQREPSAWVWRDRVQGQSFLATQRPSAGSTSPTTRLEFMLWTSLLQFCGESVAHSWYLFWQPTTQQARPVCTGRAGSGSGRTPWFCECCPQLRRVVLTRATSRDAAIFEAGLDRYRLVDMLIRTTTLSVCQELFNQA